MPVHHNDTNGYIDIMNAMYEMIQFVIDVSIYDEFSATLPSYFMQHALIKFGMCYLITLDDSTSLKISFIAMCEVLNLTRKVLAKINHKCLQ